MSTSPTKNVSREDFHDLRRAMERFDDKLDKSFQGQQEIRVQIEQLNGRISTHEANVKTGMSDLAGKMEQAKSALELKAAKDNAQVQIDSQTTKHSVSEIQTKDAVRWGVLIAIAMLLLNLLAGVAKDYISHFIK